MINILSGLNFNDANILIVGDLMLDRYYYGSVSRISPEAPVPVVRVTSESSTMGGAGNVANNVKGLTSNCTVVGCAAYDEAGRMLADMFKNIEADYEFIENGLPTISKLRVIGSKQQIVRLDFEDIVHFSAAIIENIKKSIDKYIYQSNVIVISDYGKGVCSKEICEYIINKSKEFLKPVVIDPKGSLWDKYQNAYLITPNVKELSEVVGYDVPNEDDDIIRAGSCVREKYNLTYLVVTRSEKGITIIGKDYYKTMPTVAREVFDVSGAGDTVVASLSVFLGLGLDIEKAVIFANAAAGVVVGKLGTAPISLSELSYYMQGIHTSKIIPIEHIESIVKKEKNHNKKIIFTNGCFDILHRGHVDYLRKAKALGDILILGLNSDSSVKMLKGDSRPINNEQDRAFLLESLECIDYVVIFNEETPYNLIKLVQPDILVKGGDYKAEDVVGREFAGMVTIIDFINGYSTTNTINKINEVNK